MLLIEPTSEDKVFQLLSGDIGILGNAGEDIYILEAIPFLDGVHPRAVRLVEAIPSGLITLQGGETENQNVR